MKNMLKVSGIIACLAVIGLVAACSGNGTGSGGSTEPGERNDPTVYEPLVFISIVDGEILEIIISREQDSRTVKIIDEIKAGDRYVIKKGNKIISTGIITAVGPMGSNNEREIVFTPSSDSPNGQTPFTGILNTGDQVHSEGGGGTMGTLSIEKLRYGDGYLEDIFAEEEANGFGSGAGGGGGGGGPLPGHFVVSTTAEWNNVINTIKAGGNNKGYRILIRDNFNVPGTKDVLTFGTNTDINIMINSGIAFNDIDEDGYFTPTGSDYTLTLTGTGNLLNIGSRQYVWLNGIHLKGHNANDAALVVINGEDSRLAMTLSSIHSNNNINSGGGVFINDGFLSMDYSKIYNNTTNANGGGVYVYRQYDSSYNNSINGVEMWGNSSVSGNTSADNGGGIFVNEFGRLTMSDDSKIYNNTTSTSGGGVYFIGSSFNIYGGTIYGSNETNPALRNTATVEGAAISGGWVTYGPFGHNIPTPRETTARVVDGVLQP